MRARAACQKVVEPTHSDKSGIITRRIENLTPRGGGAYTDGTGRETCRRRVDWRPLRLQLGRHGYLHSKETVDGLGGGDGIFPRNARLGAAASSTGGKERGRAFASITGTRWASSAARRVDLLRPKRPDQQLDCDAVPDPPRKSMQRAICWVSGSCYFIRS